MSSDKSSSLLSFYLFAHDITIISENNLQKLESVVNRQLVKVNEWLKANKLSLNIKITFCNLSPAAKENVPHILDKDS